MGLEVVDFRIFRFLVKMTKILDYCGRETFKGTGYVQGPNSWECDNRINGYCHHSECMGSTLHRFLLFFGVLGDIPHFCDPMRSLKELLGDAMTYKSQVLLTDDSEVQKDEK